jgi:hypothetical protein
MDTGAMAVPIAGVRFGHRRFGAAASQGPRPDGSALAGGLDNRNTWLQRSLQPGWTPVHITLF